jgi:hypothetical protein
MTLTSLYQVVYYRDGMRLIYWPATHDAQQLRDKLAEARYRGFSNARLVSV